MVNSELDFVCLVQFGDLCFDAALPLHVGFEESA